MGLTLLLLYLSWLMTCLSSSCMAIPMTQLVAKRGPINCQPIHPIQRLVFRDCVGAYNRMVQTARDLQRTVTFGVGPNVDVPINGDPLTWDFRTYCARNIACPIAGH